MTGFMVNIKANPITILVLVKIILIGCLFCIPQGFRRIFYSFVSLIANIILSIFVISFAFVWSNTDDTDDNGEYSTIGNIFTMCMLFTSLYMNLMISIITLFKMVNCYRKEYLTNFIFILGFLTIPYIILLIIQFKQYNNDTTNISPFYYICNFILLFHFVLIITLATLLCRGNYYHHRVNDDDMPNHYVEIHAEQE